MLQKLLLVHKNEMCIGCNQCLCVCVCVCKKSIEISRRRLVICSENFKIELSKICRQKQALSL